MNDSELEQVEQLMVQRQHDADFRASHPEYFNRILKLHADAQLATARALEDIDKRHDAKRRFTGAAPTHFGGLTQ